MPASYRTVTETIVVQPARVDIDVIPAKYETRSERVLVEPARQEWKPGSQAINAGSLSGAGGQINTRTQGQFTVFNGTSNQVVQSTETRVSQTGEILCLVQIPAVYKTITKQVVATPARTVERQIPAVTKQITKRVVDLSLIHISEPTRPY